MRGQWHVNNEGEVGKCSADSQCPFEANGEHTDDKAEALKVAEKFHAKHHSALLKQAHELKDAAITNEKTLFEISELAVAAERQLENNQNWLQTHHPDSEEYTARLNQLQQQFDMVRLRHGQERQAFYDMQKARHMALELDSRLGAESILSAETKKSWQESNLGAPAGLNDKGFPKNTRGSKKGETLYQFFANKNITFNEVQPKELEQELAEQLSAWSGQSLGWAREQIEAYKPQSDGGEFDSRDEYIINLFKQNMQTEKDYVCVDLETTGLDHGLSDIVEIGIRRIKPDGTVVYDKQELFDMSDGDTRRSLGTGVEHVHKISPQMLEGKRKFNDPAVQAEYSKLLNDPNTIFVAHNDTFEHAHLSEHLKGFWENHAIDGPQGVGNSDYAAGIGTPSCAMLDTRVLSSFLLDTPNNRLQSFYPATTGKPYADDAHRALVDSIMTAEALTQFREKFAEAEPGQRPHSLLPSISNA